MKVIQKGRPQKDWAKEFTCTGNGNGGGGCGAVLLVEKADIFRTTSARMGESESFLTFECCECKVWNDIPKRDYPLNTTGILSHKEWKKAKSS